MKLQIIGIIMGNDYMLIRMKLPQPRVEIFERRKEGAEIGINAMEGMMEKLRNTPIAAQFMPQEDIFQIPLSVEEYKEKKLLVGDMIDVEIHFWSGGA